MATAREDSGSSSTDSDNSSGTPQPASETPGHGGARPKERTSPSPKNRWVDQGDSSEDSTSGSDKTGDNIAVKGRRRSPQHQELRDDTTDETFARHAEAEDRSRSNVCDRALGNDSASDRSTCSYCEQHYPSDCLVPVRLPYSSTDSIDLHPTDPTQWTTPDRGELVTSSSPNGQDNEAASSTRPDSQVLRDFTETGGQTGNGISMVNELVIGGSSNSVLVREIVRTQATGELPTTWNGRQPRMACTNCIEAMNRVCGVCRMYLHERTSLIMLQCSRCDTYFHSRCLRNRERVGIYHHQYEWLCEFCDPSDDTEDATGYRTP